MAPPATVYVISSFIWDDDDEMEGVREPEVYTSKAAANKAARQLMFRYGDILNPLGNRDEYNYHHNLDNEGLLTGEMDGGPHGHVVAKVCVYQVKLNQPGTRDKAKRYMKGDGNWPDPEPLKKEDEEDDEQDNTANEEDEGEDDDEDRKGNIKDADPPTSKSAVPTKRKASTTKAKAAPKLIASRKKIPKGIPDCLAGVKLLFTGTFETMDRVTSIATANKYGATVVTKLEDTDYIVTGARIGPKKAEVINELELETINEDEFFEILKNGVSDDKRERMANKRNADEAEAPEEPEKPQKPKAATKRKGTKK